jgi:hypothetical protein
MKDFDLEMEMPTPCEHCGKTFDLNNGGGSYKWYPGTTICKECWEAERKEIEEDDRWEEINIEISNALYKLKKEEGAWDVWWKLSLENRTSIMQLINSGLYVTMNSQV